MNKLKLQVLFSAILALFLLAYCSSKDENGKGSPSDKDAAIADTGDDDDNDDGTLKTGGFKIEADAERALINILTTSGDMVLEGIGHSEISEEGQPVTGFAVREAEMKYEMKFGAFKPIDEFHSPWVAAKTLSAERKGESVVVKFKDAKDKEIARAEFVSEKEGHLEIKFSRLAAYNRASFGFKCHSDENFMGFGAQTWDVNHRGQTVPTWVQEQGIGKVEHNDYSGSWFLVGRRHSSHMPIPQFLSSKGYMMFAETPLRATFALCSESETSSRVEFEMPASIHIFYGPSPKQAIERSSERFGRPRIPPDFAFSPWLDAIYGSENVLRVAKKLRELGIPSSAIWTEDWKGATWEGNNYVLSEEWGLDRNIYPDFEELAEELHQLGFKFLVYFNTFIYKETEAFRETSEKGYLIKDRRGNPYLFMGHKMSESSLLDLSNPGARQWALEKLQDAIKLGVDGWMGDFAEWMPTDAVTYEGDGLSQHNLHPVQWQEVQREAIDGAGDGVERLLFARSGWIGSPSLADVVWAGDQRTSFDEDDGMPTILPIGIGLGISSISTYGHDIAGYQSATNDPSTKELFFRWTTLGAWSPVMRTHHGYSADLNWNWEKDDETTKHFAKYARLHIALAPYWKGLAKLANETGLPIWRGLGVEFPQEARVWSIKDQVMVGEGIMIAPIMEAGAVSRDVYFPEGRWFAWEGGEGTIEGGATKKIESPIEHIAVFARAGAIVPMYPEGVMTLANQSEKVPGPELVGSDRVIKVFMGADGSFVENEGAAYKLVHKKAFSGEDIEWLWKGKKLGSCSGSGEADCIEISEAGFYRIKAAGWGSLEAKEGGDTVSVFETSAGKIAKEPSFVFEMAL